MTPQELRQFIERRGWTQRQASEELGVAFSTIGHWLHERRRIPRILDRLVYWIDRALGG